MAAVPNYSHNDPNPYEIRYLREIIKVDIAEPPEKAKLGTYAEACEALYMQHRKGGAKAARKALHDQIAQDYPDLVEIIISPPRWKRHSAESLFDTPKPQYLYGTELIEGSYHVLYGRSGTGKSFVALDYALTIAQNHSVLYIAGEGRLGYGKRVAAWCKHHRNNPGKLDFVWEQVPLMDALAIDLFIAELLIGGQPPKLLIIDTLAWAMAGGDENSARDMQVVNNNINRIIDHTGAAVLLVHHTGKNGDMERGSSALRGAAEVMIEVSNDDGYISIKCTKSKDDAPFEQRYLEQITVEGLPDQPSCVLLPADKLAKTPQDKLSQQQREILEFLALETFTKTGAKSHTILKQLPNISNPYRVLSNLKARGFIDQDTKGDPFYITSTGRGKLTEHTTN